MFSRFNDLAVTLTSDLISFGGLLGCSIGWICEGVLTFGMKLEMIYALPWKVKSNEIWKMEKLCYKIWGNIPIFRCVIPQRIIDIWLYILCNVQMVHLLNDQCQIWKVKIIFQVIVLTHSSWRKRKLMPYFPLRHNRPECNQGLKLGCNPQD